MTNSPTFLAEADAVFGAVQNALTAAPEVNADHSGNILAMRFADGTRCTLNRQDAIEQIWLSDGVLTWHFERDPTGNAWVDTIGRGPLFEIVGAMLGRRLGRPVEPGPELD